MHNLYNLSTNLKGVVANSFTDGNEFIKHRLDFWNITVPVLGVVIVLLTIVLLMVLVSDYKLKRKK